MNINSGLFAGSMLAMLILAPQGSAAPLKVACIGNSITAGFGIPEAERAAKSYPAVLQQKLGAGYIVNNYGASGTTLLKQGTRPYWDQGAFTNSHAWLPDIVILQLGTNDANPANKAYWSGFQADYIDMVNSYKNLSSHPKMYCNLPPAIYLTKPTDASDSALAKYIIPAIKEAARLTAPQVIDVHSATSGKPELFPDKLHPDSIGARLIAETVYQAFRATGISQGGRQAWASPLDFSQAFWPGALDPIRPDGRLLGPAPIPRE